MTDEEIIAELKREPAAELRRMQKQPYEWKVEEMIFSTFKNCVVPYDKNLTNYQKETKKLLELCKKACERIAKEA